MKVVSYWRVVTGKAEISPKAMTLIPYHTSLFFNEEGISGAREGAGSVCKILALHACGFEFDSPEHTQKCWVW